MNKAGVRDRSGTGHWDWLSPFSRGDVILREPDGLGQHREHRRHRVELCRHLRELGLGYPSLRDLRGGVGPPKVMGRWAQGVATHVPIESCGGSVRVYGVSICKQCDVLS